MQNIQWFVEITGVSYRTVKSRLAGVKAVMRGRDHLYETSEALPLIVLKQAATGSLDIDVERARRVHHQANIAQKEEAVMDGKLMSVEEVERGWVEIVSGVRSKVLAVPAKINSCIQPGQSMSGEDIESISRQLIEKALKELID